MTQPMAAVILWRRLDTPGHEACRLTCDASGWTLDGTAVYRARGEPARLTYRVAGEPGWRTKRANVRGWLGPRPIDLAIACTDDGRWTLGGAIVPGLAANLDFDLGFTPATNLPQLRRIALAAGQQADVPAAWLDVHAGSLTLLPQRYAWRSESTYWYTAPTANYEGLLEIGAHGFIRKYPGLWAAES